jgi:hypothetical protein
MPPRLVQDIHASMPRHQVILLGTACALLAAGLYFDAWWTIAGGAVAAAGAAWFATEPTRRA